MIGPRGMIIRGIQAHAFVIGGLPIENSLLPKSRQTDRAKRRKCRQKPNLRNFHSASFWKLGSFRRKITVRPGCRQVTYRTEHTTSIGNTNGILMNACAELQTQPEETRTPGLWTSSDAVIALPRLLAGCFRSSKRAAPISAAQSARSSKDPGFAARRSFLLPCR